MFQDTLSFDTSEINEFKTFNDKPFSISHYFNSDSLIADGALPTEITRKGQTETRLTPIGSNVDSYRNLNMPKYFSIRARDGEHKGKVVGYAQSVIIRNPTFVVGEKSRQRIINIEFKKNVHAFCRGEFVNAFNSTVIESRLPNSLRVSYSPYMAGHFYTVDRDETGAIDKSKMKPVLDSLGYEYAIVSGSDVLLTNF